MPDVVANEITIQSFFTGLRGTKKELAVGLLIGKSSIPSKQLVCAAVLAPPAEDSAGEGVDGEWLAEQGRQMAEMLAGGLSVVGVFLHASAKSFDSNLSTLSTAVRTLRGNVILHSDSARPNIAAKFLEAKAGAKPVTCPFSMDKALCSLYIVTGRVSIDTSALYSSDYKPAVETAISQFKKEIQSSRVMIQEMVIDGTSSDMPLSKWLKKVGVASNSKEFKASFLTPAGKKVSQRLAVESKVKGRLYLTGTIAVRAAVHSRETMATIVELLKQDAISSLEKRVSLAAEEAAAGNAEPGWACLNSGKAAKESIEAAGIQDTSWSASLPVRVTVHDEGLPRGAISDYALPEDTEEDIHTRLEEIASDTFKNCPLVWSEIAKKPDISFAKPSLAQAGSQASNSLHQAMNKLWFIIAVMVALASFVVRFVFKNFI